MVNVCSNTLQMVGVFMPVPLYVAGIVYAIHRRVCFADAVQTRRIAPRRRYRSRSAARSAHCVGRRPAEEAQEAEQDGRAGGLT